MCQLKKDGGRCQGYRTSENIRSLKKKGDATGAANLTTARDKYGSIVSHMDILMPKSIANLITSLEEIGDPLLVGGTVRDVLAPGSAAPKDFDIEVHGADMDSIAASLRKNGYRVDEVGKAFGVLKVFAGGEDVDISVPRRDSLQGEGHRGFTVEIDKDMSVTEAAERRDFTINAMMYSPGLNACIDPHDGREDLKNGVLRHVSDAFGEDPLRPLRGFQFAGRYGLTMHPDTVRISQELLSRSGELPKERIRTEWSKFYGKCQDSKSALKVLRDTGWDKVVGGFGSVSDESVQRSFDVTKDAGITGGRKTVVIASVISSQMDDKSAETFLRSTIDDGDRVIGQARVLRNSMIPDVQDRPSLRQWARSLGKRGLTVQDWEMKERSLGNNPSEVVEKTKKLGIYDTHPEDFIMGRHVISAFPDRKPGPWVSKAVADAQARQDKGDFAALDDAVEWLSKQDATTW